MVKGNKGRRSKQFVENECNEIFKLIIDGASDKEIQQTRNLPERTYFDYKARLAAKLHNQNVNIRNDHILFYKEVTKERLLNDKQAFQAVMNDYRTNPKARVAAAQADAEVNITLFKLENETQMFVNTIRKQQADVLDLDIIADRERSKVTNSYHPSHLSNFKQ
jgi:xanthine dehydrogenase iron-sulfur cluster and FAD-binding subunit A